MSIMNPLEAVMALSSYHQRSIVLSGIGMGRRAWHKIHGERDKSFHNHAMGLTPSIALGLALGVGRDREVLALDGDGGFVLDIGAVLLLAEHQPPNLTYAIMDNRSFGVIGSELIANVEQTNYVELAKSVGIRQASSVQTVAELDEYLQSTTAKGEFRFLVLRVEGDFPVERVAYEGPEIKYRFVRALEESHGIKTLGPKGY